MNDFADWYLLGSIISLILSYIYNKIFWDNSSFGMHLLSIISYLGILIILVDTLYERNRYLSNSWSFFKRS